MKNIIALFFLLVGIACTYAQEVQIAPLDNNTSGDNFAPAVTAHGRMLVVTNDDGNEQRLGYMQRTSSGWSSVSEISGDVNDGEHVGTATLTPDGQMIIFAAFNHSVKGFGRTDLYSAVKSGGDWTSITNLGPNINSSFYDSQPTLSPDGRTLVFVSDRGGNSDLYISTYNGKEWSSARPVQGVATQSEEMSPVIATDGKSFTFASNRPGGLGGYDIYTGKLDATGNVTGVKSIGAPVNTAADEMFYTPLANSNQAYFSRTTANGDYDNFMAVPNPFMSEPVTMVEGKVLDAIDKKPVGAEVVVTDLTTGKQVSSFKSDDKTGDYFVTLPAGRIYSITAKRPGYVFHSERFEVPPDAQGKSIQKDIELSPLENGSGALLVFFDYDKSELKSESTPELERIIELLKDNPNLKVQFEGHTDDQGTDDYNLKLSERRATAVKDYVVTGGVEQARVAAKGLGKKNPLKQGTTDEARSVNRRVEMRVVSSK